MGVTLSCCMARGLLVVEQCDININDSLVKIFHILEMKVNMVLDQRTL